MSRRFKALGGSSQHINAGLLLSVLFLAPGCRSEATESRRSTGNDAPAESRPAPTAGPLNNELSEEELRKAFAATLEKYRKAPQQEYAQTVIARSLQSQRKKNSLNIRMKASVGLVTKTKGLTGFADQGAAIRAAGGQVRKTLAESNVLALDFPAATDERYLAAVIDFLKSDSRIDIVEPDYIVRAIGIPDDTRFNELWGLRNASNGIDIKAVPAWDATTGSRSVVIGVIDSGIDCTHQDLAANCWVNPGESGLDSSGRNKRTNGVDDDGNGYVDDWQGWNFSNGSNQPKDDNNHGTHVAGTIGATGNNNLGVTGVNWQVSIVPLKFLDKDGGGYLSDALEAIDYATRLRMFATNNSWGGGGYSVLMHDAIRRASNAGVFFVAAAGNESNDNDWSPSYPANYDAENVISVAAVNSSGALAPFSSYGRNTVDLAGPGVDILSTTPGNQYASYSGTSMATPHITGILGLLKARYPQESMINLKSRLLGSTSSLPALAGKVATGGLGNVNNALNFTPDLEVPSAPGSLTVGEQDVEPPATGATSAQTTGVADLSFTCSGDDGTTGSATRYEFRISSASITTDIAWNNATRLSLKSITCGAAGTSGSAVVSGISPGFSGYITARAYDESGNPSASSASTAFNALTLPVRKAYDGSSVGEMLVNNGWVTETDPDRGTVYSDGAGSYAPDANKSFTLQTIPIGEAQRIVLQYWSAISLESGFDYAKVIVRGVPGTGIQPVTVDTSTGYSPWTLRSIDLTDIAFRMRASGATALQVDFQMTADSSIQYQGWLVDDINVRINDSLFLVSGIPQGDSTNSALSVTLALPGTATQNGLYTTRLVDVTAGAGLDCTLYTNYRDADPKISFTTPFTATLNTTSEKFLCLRTKIPGVKYRVHAWRSWRFSSRPPAVTGSGFPAGQSNTRSFTLRAIPQDGTFTTSWSHAVVTSPPALVTGACLATTLTWSTWLPVEQSATITVPYTAGSAQTVVLCMRGKNDTGTIQSTPTWYSWLADFEPPVMTLADLPAIRNNLRSFGVTIQGPADIDSCMAQVVSGNACPAGETINTACTIAPTKWTVTTDTDGTYTLCVRGRDRTGNLSTAPAAFTWTRKTTPPVAVLAGTPPKSSANPNGRITVSGTDVVNYKMAIAASVQGCTSWSVLTPVAAPVDLSIIPGADGPRVLCVKGYDDLGNEQVTPTTLAWTQDTAVSPLVFSGLPTNPSRAQRLDITVSASEPGTYRHAVSAGISCDTQRLANASPQATSVKISDTLPLADGAYNICASFTDAAGNTQSAPTTWTWVKDTLPPVSTLSSLPPRQTTDTAVAVTVRGTSVVEYQWSLMTNSVSCINAQYSDFLPVATRLATSAGVPGTKILCVRGRDLAGNLQTNATYHTWTLLPTPPPAPVQAVITSGGMLSPNNIASYSIQIGGTGVTRYQAALVRSMNTDCPATAAWGPWTSPLLPAAGAVPSGNAFWTLCIRGKSADGRVQGTPTVHRWLRFAGAPLFTQATLFGALERGSPTETAESIIINRTHSLTPAENVSVYLCNLNPDNGVVSNCIRQVVTLPEGNRRTTVTFSGVASGSWISIGLPASALRGRIRHVAFTK